MCGIAGYVGLRSGARGADADLSAMCGRITYRGPDDEGHFVVEDGGPLVALGMRRLAIIDVARGKQPIANEDGTIHIVFNGEIYNHRELQAGLERAGHTFRTHSDTEALVHLYEEHGVDMVRHLRGMFAFAIWDAPRQRLFVARDRLGQKPLYYWPHDGGVAIASEAVSLLELEGFRPRLSRRAIAEYLMLGYVPDPHCVYEGAHKLPPAHRLVWEPGKPLQVDAYWSPIVPEVARSADDAVHELRALLASSVGSHLESEVPLGAFLSGGVDSSAVVSEMTRQVSGRVRTFSIGFHEDEFNEAPHAAAVARALGTDHTELIVDPDADALINRVILGFDEPFADSSALPTFLVSELARRDVTVTLSGDGGDELFGGYTRYAEVMRRMELPAVVRHPVGAIARRLPHGTYGRNRLLDLARTRPGRYTTTVATPLRVAEGGVARAEVAAECGRFEDLLRPLFAGASGRDLATQMMLVDIGSYLPGDILTKVDRMSMAVSLESRVPLLDHPLVEFAVSLPSALKMRDGTGKWIFREAIRGLVPDIVLTHPKKGFAVPLVRWFRHELRHRVDALLSPDSPTLEYTDAAAVRRLASEHLSGRRDHSAMLWRLLVLDLWLRDRAAREGGAGSDGAGLAGARRAVAASA